MQTSFLNINGLQVANIKNNSELAYFGIVVLAGSNYESPKIAGISHFVEHMFFKGTEKRNWKQINEDFAKLGVSNNAYTSNTEVLYHTTCPKENLFGVIEIMMDMFFNSTFPEIELEKERKVIQEERAMYEDDHVSYFHNVIGDKLFTWEKGHATIGTQETIQNISRQDMINYLMDKYSLNNIMFVCCGNISNMELVKCIEKYLPTSHPYLNDKPLHQVRDELWSDEVKKADKIKLLIEREQLQQTHIRMMINNLSVFDPKRMQQVVLIKAIGGGMFSKLYSRIREELGLCYGVGIYTQPMAYPDYMLTALYGTTTPSNTDLFIEESEKILRDVIKNGIDANLFECAKTDCIAGAIRATETSEGMAQYMSNRYLFGKRDEFKDVLARMREVTLEECNEIAPVTFDMPYNWAIMKPKEE
jgi:predicted Zn-dependent peptidase